MSVGESDYKTPEPFLKRITTHFLLPIYLPVLGAMVSLPMKVQGDVVMSKEAGAPSATQTSAIGSPCIYSIPLGHYWDTSTSEFVHFYHFHSVISLSGEFFNS